jgi:predicted metal-dependent peptidase
MGQTGACIDRLVGEMTKGSVDWRAITQSFVQEATGSYEYDWCKPNPQYLERDIFFPSLVREEEMRDLVIAIDTSGSVSKELLTQFIGECQNAMETLRPERMMVMQFDHQIQEVTVYDRDDLIPVTRLKGGGGTRFEPIFEHIEKNQIDPICLMVFTDLDGSFPKCPPNYPVLWLAYGAGNTKTPFGQVAEITL